MIRDWINVILGFWMAVSPWILGLDRLRYPHVVSNCLFTGILIGILSLIAAYREELWLRLTVIVLALWLLIAPATLAYTGAESMIWNNVVTSFFVTALSLWRLEELWLRGHVRR